MIRAILLAVALYPVYAWLARRLGDRRGLAAFLLRLRALATVLGPVSILASIPYEKVKYDAPKLGKREKRPGDRVADRTARNVVPAVF